MRETGGLPIQDILADAFCGPIRFHTTMEGPGRFVFRGLPAGTCRVEIRRAGLWTWETRVLRLLPGESATADFELPRLGALAGKLADDEGNPLPHFQVRLLRREYDRGVLRYAIGRTATADDEGRYRIPDIPPGIGHLLVARPPADREVDEVPSVYPPVYYPDADTIGAAQTITLRDGEEREGMDFRISRTPAFCVAGSIQAGTPGVFQYILRPAEPASGMATFGGQRRGQTDAEGNFRTCGWPRGEYRLLSWRPAPQPGMEAFYGTAEVFVADRHSEDVRVTPAPRIPLAGRLVWDGQPPREPFEQPLTVSIRPANGVILANVDTSRGGTASLPGEFTFLGRQDDYDVAVQGLRGRLYVKGMVYAGESVLGRPMRLGARPGPAELTVTIGQDGALLGAVVTDREGGAIPHAWVSMVPEHATSAADLSVSGILQQTDQSGRLDPVAVAPGKYRVLGWNWKLDRTPESLERIWGARSRATEVTADSAETVEVKVAVQEID
ncbi:MAG: carboxypeptidase regulatory-like domain-containing protein [Bryobacterales bacterium]|nr:carboxypeptidase regulatory-like domain-containing protein [Bryobacterales bacterium]